MLLVDADPQGSTRTWGAVAAEAGHPTPTIVAMGATMHRPGQLDAVGQPYDVVIVDCPPRHGEIMKSALLVADIAVLPCGPSAMDGWALAESLDVVGQARVLRPMLKAGVLITRRTRTVLSRGARDALADCGLPILTTELGYRVTFQEAPAAGRGITDYAPKSSAADEVRALVDELLTFTEVDHGKEGHIRAA